jgi:hypothetical protein
MIRSTGRRTLALLALLALLLGPGIAAGEEPAGAGAQVAPPPAAASDEEAAEALAAFKKAFAARGLKGDDKLAEQDFALRELSAVQHPKVIQAIAKETKNRSIEIRTAAVLYLGRQRAFPATAGEQIVAAMKRNGKDATFLMAGLEAIGELGYLGATEMLADLMKHPDYAVVKNALVTIGELKDARFIEEICKLLKELKIEAGASWDGVEAHVDTGTAGDADQKAAEAQGKAMEAANKQKGKRAARTQRDLGPVVLMTMKDLTGESFTGGIAARKWLEENKDLVARAIADIGEKAAAQK